MPAGKSDVDTLTIVIPDAVSPEQARKLSLRDLIEAGSSKVGHARNSWFDREKGRACFLGTALIGAQERGLI